MASLEEQLRSERERHAVLQKVVSAQDSYIHDLEQKLAESAKNANAHRGGSSSAGSVGAVGGKDDSAQIYHLRSQLEEVEKERENEKREFERQISRLKSEHAEQLGALMEDNRRLHAQVIDQRESMHSMESEVERLRETQGKERTQFQSFAKSREVLILRDKEETVLELERVRKQLDETKTRFHEFAEELSKESDRLREASKSAEELHRQEKEQLESQLDQMRSVMEDRERILDEERRMRRIQMRIIVAKVRHFFQIDGKRGSGATDFGSHAHMSSATTAATGTPMSGGVHEDGILDGYDRPHAKRGGVGRDDDWMIHDDEDEYDDQHSFEDATDLDVYDFLTSSFMAPPASLQQHHFYQHPSSSLASSSSAANVAFSQRQSSSMMQSSEMMESLQMRCRDLEQERDDLRESLEERHRLEDIRNATFEREISSLKESLEAANKNVEMHKAEQDATHFEQIRVLDGRIESLEAQNKQLRMVEVTSKEELNAFKQLLVDQKTKDEDSTEAIWKEIHRRILAMFEDRERLFSSHMSQLEAELHETQQKLSKRTKDILLDEEGHLQEWLVLKNGLEEYKLKWKDSLGHSQKEAEIWKKRSQDLEAIVKKKNEDLMMIEEKWKKAEQDLRKNREEMDVTVKKVERENKDMQAKVLRALGVDVDGDGRTTEFDVFLEKLEQLFEKNTQLFKDDGKRMEEQSKILRSSEEACSQRLLSTETELKARKEHFRLERERMRKEVEFIRNERTLLAEQCKNLQSQVMTLQSENESLLSAFELKEEAFQKSIEIYEIEAKKYHEKQEQMVKQFEEERKAFLALKRHEKNEEEESSTIELLREEVAQYELLSRNLESKLSAVREPLVNQITSLRTELSSRDRRLEEMERARNAEMSRLSAALEKSSGDVSSQADELRKWEERLDLQENIQKKETKRLEHLIRQIELHTFQPSAESVGLLAQYHEKRDNAVKAIWKALEKLQREYQDALNSQGQELALEKKARIVAEKGKEKLTESYESEKKWLQAEIERLQNERNDTEAKFLRDLKRKEEELGKTRKSLEEQKKVLVEQEALNRQELKKLLGHHEKQAVADDAQKDAEIDELREELRQKDMILAMMKDDLRSEMKALKEQISLHHENSVKEVADHQRTIEQMQEMQRTREMHMRKQLELAKQTIEKLNTELSSIAKESEWEKKDSEREINRLRNLLRESDMQRAEERELVLKEHEEEMIALMRENKKLRDSSSGFQR